MCGDWLADDETIFGEFTDRLTRVGGGDFGRLIWIKPDLALSAVQYGSRKALLGGEIDPIQHKRSAFILWSVVGNFDDADIWGGNSGDIR